MSNKKSGLSVSKRREEMRQRKEAQRKRHNIFLGLLLAIIVISAVAYLLTRDGDEESGAVVDGERPLAALEPVARSDYYSQYPPMVIDTAQSYEAIITVAGKGEMRLRLFPEEAPLTVNNFVYLANQGFYDGITFHRVIEDFMAQSGDPTGSGGGGPGYEFEDETDTGLSFDRRGLLAMANAGPGTNGSQFFITFAETPWLDGLHTIFGELVSGDEVLSALTITVPGQTPDMIDKIEIVTP